MNNEYINARIQGLDKLYFDWLQTSRIAAAAIIPTVLVELKRKAPVSAVKPDAGRFRDSIGYRIDTEGGVLKINFVSTASYAPYVINPTQGGTIIEPQNTLALRYADGFGDYIFASSVIRGDTPGNDFNVQVKDKIGSFIQASFARSIVTFSTQK